VQLLRPCRPGCRERRWPAPVPFFDAVPSPVNRNANGRGNDPTRKIYEAIAPRTANPWPGGARQPFMKPLLRSDFRLGGGAEKYLESMGRSLPTPTVPADVATSIPLRPRNVAYVGRPDTGWAVAAGCPQ